MSNKRIAIFGASSFVGSYICKAFSENVALATYYTNQFDGGVFFDATNMDSKGLLIKNGITHAIIVFAEPDVDSCKKNQLQSYKINVTSTKKIIDTCFCYGIKPIFLSSEYVFDGKKGLYSESDKPTPNTFYGRQKLEIENYLLDSNLPHAILRLAKVYGTEKNDKSILSVWGNQIIRKEVIQSATDQFFTPVNVEFVAEAAKQIINCNLDGIYHIAGNVHVSRYELLMMVKQAANIDITCEKVEMSNLVFIDNRPLNLTLVSAKLMSDTKIVHRDLKSDLKIFCNNFFNP